MSLPNKDLTLNPQCQNKLLSGMDKTARVIRATMGAKGQIVAIEGSGGGVVFTKDGANTARQIKLKDPVEDIGSKMIIEAAINTADQAGDGTTSTTVLLHELVKAGLKSDEKITLAGELDKVCEILVSEIDKMSKKISTGDVKDLESIARISSNGDDAVANLVVDMVRKVGAKGSISVMDSGTSEDRTEVITGANIPSGFFSGYFINKPKKRICEFENPLIMVTDFDFYKIDHIAPIIEIAGPTNRPVVIIGSNFEGEALSTLIYNVQQGGLKACAIQAPGGSGMTKVEALHDLAAVTGGKFLSDTTGHSFTKVHMEDFGECEKLTAYHNKTIIAGGAGDIEGYVEDLAAQIEEESNPAYAQDLENRISSISGGIGAIYVGDSASTAHNEKMDRVEDAVLATQSAVEEGIVAGGGRCYLDLSNIDLSDYSEAGKIVKIALRAPMAQICENAGLNGEVYVERCSEYPSPICMDVVSKRYVNALDVGIVDPAKVVRCAIQNAFKNASTILKTAASITIETE